MSDRYAKFTTEQLNSNRKTLFVLRLIMSTLVLIGIIVVLIWIFVGRFDSKKIMAAGPVMAAGITILPIHIQISAIDKELKSRAKSE